MYLYLGGFHPRFRSSVVGGVVFGLGFCLVVLVSMVVWSRLGGLSSVSVWDFEESIEEVGRSS